MRLSIGSHSSPPLWGQGVHDGVALFGHPPLDHSRGLEVAEPVGEQVRGHAGETIEQLAVAGGSHEELADDRQTPPVTHDIESPPISQTVRKPFSLTRTRFMASRTQWRAGALRADRR
jgi:hypothetical protein